MRWLKGLVVLCSLLFLTSCAAQQSVRFIDPAKADIENKAIISAPFDSTWDRLVRNLSKEFFVINNIDKESRLINVSFSTNDPQDFVNCGVTRREYASPAGKREQFSYEVARDSKYRSADDNGFPWDVWRRTDLEGRANIYIAPLGEQTEISVNIRYTFNVAVTTQPLNKYEQPVGRPMVDNYATNFDTTRPSVGSDTTAACTSAGILERQILDAART